jgi:hypothetical protein
MVFILEAKSLSFFWKANTKLAKHFTYIHHTDENNSHTGRKYSVTIINTNCGFGLPGFESRLSYSLLV